MAAVARISQDGTRVIFNGPFLTGIALDGDRLRTEGYTFAQERLLREVGGTSAGWSCEPTQQGDAGLRFTPRGQQNERVLPLSFIRYESSAGEMVLLTPQTLPTWTMDSLSIDFFDFGVGVLSVHFRVLATTQDVRALQREVEGSSSTIAISVKDRLSQLCEDFSRSVRSHLEEDVVSDPWFWPTDIEVSPFAAPGQLLWLHRVYAIMTDTS